MNEQHYDIKQLVWWSEELDWNDCLSKPNTDEQKFGSADRPPKYWIDMSPRPPSRDTRDIFGPTINLRPRYGLD